MSQQLLDHSSDLKRLQEEGYEVDIQAGYLMIHNVPYVNSNREIKRGILISALELSGDKTVKPSSHIALFAGGHPCNKDGSIIVGIQHQSCKTQITEGIVANFSFSNKPSNGYVDYYEKMSRYIDIISAPAKSLDKSVTAKTFKDIVFANESNFVYEDTNSSRANINALSSRMAGMKIGIVGLGGSGGYILDLIAKTPVAEIHLFDGDNFLQHNAFRAPGAAKLDLLKSQPKKVDYLSSIYSNMHKHIYAHSEFISEKSLSLLENLDFVFVCIDKGCAKRTLFSYLEIHKIPFIDVGMGLQVENESLSGILRVTCIRPGNESYISKLINFNDKEDDVYSTNIQIAELNMFTAALAVITWKKQLGFFGSISEIINSNYTISTNSITCRMRDEKD